MGKMGACIALSAAMMLTSVGGMLPSDWSIETVYADETKTTNKTFTADQLRAGLKIRKGKKVFHKATLA